MIWPLNRKRKPVHVGPTSVDWKPGDMAECVFVPEPEFCGFLRWPSVGERLMVAEVGYGLSRSGSVRAFWLRFLTYGSNEGMRSDCFRKITLTDTGADRKVSKTNPIKQGEDA